MANLDLTIYGNTVSQNQTVGITQDIVLSTEQRTDSYGMNCVVKKDLVMPSQAGNGQTGKAQTYSLTLVNIEFTKKMYQPTEIIAEIAVVIEDPNIEWSPVSPDDVEKIFKDRKVSLSERNASSNDIGDDFYVHSVKVKYGDNFMHIYLHIFSLDKLLTLDNTCRTFVGKKLAAGILSSELPNENSKYVAPYDSSKPLTFDAKSMKNLCYDLNGNRTEHIFPYLVQYNESFYDMLARTTNRWGEFLYYEDGKLNIGCPSGVAVNVGGYTSLSYYDVDDQIVSGSQYDCAAGYDKDMLKSPIRIDPQKVSGNLFCPGGEWDKIIMKKFTSFFKLDKNLPTFLGNELFNDLYDLGKQKINVSSENSAREEDYFTTDMMGEAPEQYGEEDYDGKKAMSYNPFSEISCIYDKAKYFGILKNEISAGKNAICINYDTKYPSLKLGQIISLFKKEYIVTQIECNSSKPLRLKNDLWVMTSETIKYQFLVYAIAKQGGEKGQFYPTVIPAGHVRLAEPQMAKVTDAGDPNGDGRVRVAFSWQLDGKGKVTDAVKKDATPWIQFTANAGGKKGLMGKHYKDDTVFVGFVDGNVERPYVLGAISKGAGADVHCTTPGGHQFKLKDDSAGITAFLTGMFMPVWGTLCDFFPVVGDVNAFKDDKNNLALAGGFELSDKYGIYKISGSTEDRVVNIASPWGNVNINAFTGISISAPNGDIEIKGKNVSIQAGNNLELISGKNVAYKLWKEKDTKKGTAAQALLDVTAAVTKKLAEKVTALVDLSMVRAAAEVVFKPVEGSLTVKSNRFLKLEAGKNECEYPAVAYNQEKKKKMLDAENKGTILSAVGSSTNFLGELTNMHLDNGMVTLISKIKPATEALCKEFVKKYDKCFEAREHFEDALATLEDESNDGKAGCKTFKELKKEFWAEGKYEEWKAEKLGFKDNVKIVEKAEDKENFLELRKTMTLRYALKKKGIPMTKSSIRSLSTDEAKEAMVDAMEDRIYARKEVVRCANDLRKAICELQGIRELKKKDVHKYFSVYWKAMPEGFKEKLVKAMSKEKCPKSPIYKMYDSSMELTKDAFDIQDKLYKYMRRLVAYNLLNLYGFTKETRSKVDGADVPEPSDTLDHKAANGVLNDTFWANYVKSLSGVPPIEKDSKTLGGQIRGAALSSIEDIKEQIYGLKNLRKEIATWGEGKNGRILFGTDETTYEMKNNTFVEVEGISPNVVSLNENSADLPSRKQKKLAAFVQGIRKALTDNNF